MGFDELYLTYADTVYGFLMFKLGDHTLVEDLLQETFLAVYRALDSTRPNSPKAWILSIAQHKMVDHLRRKRHTEQQLTEDLIPGEAVEQTTNLFIAESLNKLPDVERTIIYGLYAVGLTCSELGEILQIPEGTVKSKAHYARKKLRESVEGELR